ncbi:MAG: histidinol-phosphate transaminase [Halofilum sp. (in: g-proteobacteria)]|nr:histidinol-phosphate transaminase [Halofilum sp. (in: g-proteobacteria)]
MARSAVADGHRSTATRMPRAQATQARACARTFALAEGQRLVLGNGSDELIQLVTLALARPGAKVLAPEPTFVMYRMIATFCGLECIGVPLADDFALDVPAMEAAIERHDPAVVWLAWPNNPTGNLWPRADLERVVHKAGGLVVVDEAYQPFARASLVDELGRRDNLVVLRTLSKLGLAGLRLGALAGPPEWLDEIDKLRLPYNVNVLTQASAAFALEHFDRLEQQAATIRGERDRLQHDLGQLPGVTAYPSAANFVLLRVPAGRARAVFEGLLADGVLIKCLDGAHPQLADCLRVTVGTPEENARLEAALARQLHAQ